MSKDLIDAKTAAEIANVQPRTIWQYNRFGRMPAPATYFGRSPVWEREVIQAWADEKESRKSGRFLSDSGTNGPS